MRQLLVFLSFILMLSASAQGLKISRGPYLQIATQSSIIIRWNTNELANAIVNVGYEPHQLNMTFKDLNESSEVHEVQITGLTENTQYFYEVISVNTAQHKVKSEINFFKTLPLKGTDDKYSFLVLGDCGSGRPEQMEVKNMMISYFGGSHFDGVLLLGDNAYEKGTDQNYQDNFFKYDEIFANTVIWPTPGNHEYNNHIPFSKKPAYYDIFNCPKNAEAGGVASGSEKYYSYDIGNIHFVSLDSYDEKSKLNSKMANWLISDLKTNTLEWTVVYFHHPPYSKGTHNSDNPNGIDRELSKMRKRIVPILETYNVDLVLNGHSHSYERSYLLKGHYGKSKTLNEEHFVDHTSGSYPKSCPYQKNASDTSKSNGTVYCVMGCSGKNAHLKKDRHHPVMHSYDFEQYGAIILTIEANQLSSEFVTSNGKVFDTFTIVKNAGQKVEVEVEYKTLPDLKKSWKNMTVWTNDGVEFNTMPPYLTQDCIIRTSDPMNCIEDVFMIKIK
ncbi:MAG: metallophosphoesterase family protein [Bacteroidota bacterium]